MESNGAPSLLAPSPIAAAHSMDTIGFAVDDDGRVAQFDSGEFGAVPFVALDSPVVEDVWEYASSPGSRPFVSEVSMRYSPDDEPSNPSTRGLYDYRHDRYEGDFATPYLRLSRPLEPLRVDELPASIRESCPRFEGARFECDALIQPLDFFAGRANAMIPFLSVREWAMREWAMRVGSAPPCGSTRCCSSSSRSLGSSCDGTSPKRKRCSRTSIPRIARWSSGGDASERCTAQRSGQRWQRESSLAV